MIGHALLGLSVAALGGAGLRMAAQLAPRGLERALAAISFAAAMAVLEALALGLLDLGGSSLALAAAAAGTWLAARWLLPAPTVGPAAELVGWWRQLDRGARILLGAVAGAGVAWTAWLVRYPALGYDTLLYHLPESVTWVQRGSPGAVESIVSFLPVGSYPLTYEVLTAWSIGLSSSFVPATLLAPCFLALAAAAGWSALRTQGVTRVAAALAVGALVLTPPALAYGRSGAALDPAALAWLTVCAALSAGSVRRPGLLVPAVVAAGLAAGTKTTALPLTALVLGLALYAGRRRLRRLARPLVLAAVAAVGVGAIWYLRNLIDHGSPFWPFLAPSWADPVPPAVSAAEASFLDRPGETLARLDRLYLEHFGGGIVLLAGALLAPVLAPRRGVLLAAAATAASLLLWLNAPMTGVSAAPGLDEGTADAVRYLLPGLGAAAVTLALATRAGPAARTFGHLLLALALVVNLVQSLRLGFPAAPSAGTVLAGFLGGGLAALMLAALPSRPVGIRRRIPLPAAAVAAAAAGCLLTPLAGGYMERHAELRLWDSGLVAWFAERESDERPVGSTSSLHGLLAGDRLQRPLELIPPREPCAVVNRRLARGWVVSFEIVPDRIEADVRSCFDLLQPAYSDRSVRIFAPRAASARGG